VPPKEPQDPQPPRDEPQVIEGSGGGLTQEPPQKTKTETVQQPAIEPDAAGSGDTVTMPARAVDEPRGLAWSLGRLLDSAGTAAKRLAFPLTLIIIVIVFLLVQGELDRRDPKLAKAAINSELDLVVFQ
jgi:hypothetical protein